MVIQALYALTLILVAASDVWRLRIPNGLVLALAILFVVAALQRPAEVDWASHIGAALLMFIIGAALYGFGIMGAGDGKLLSATSLWIGFESLPLHLVYTALFGLIVAGCLLCLRALAPLLAARSFGAKSPRWMNSFRRGEVPYGVAIAASSLVLSAQLPLFAPTGLAD